MKIESAERNPVVIKAEQSQAAESIEHKSEKSTIQENKKISNISENERISLPVSEKFVIEAIERANKAIEGARTEFRFSIHEETHEISVKVLDKDSGEVIREIPPEKVLDMVARMWEMAGIIVDEKR